MFNGETCNLTLSYTPSGPTTLDQKEWFSHISESSATDEVDLIQVEARNLVVSLHPSRLCLKLEKVGREGEKLCYSYSYSTSQKKRRRDVEYAETGDGEETDQESR